MPSYSGAGRYKNMDQKKSAVEQVITRPEVAFFLSLLLPIVSFAVTISTTKTQLAAAEANIAENRNLIEKYQDKSDVTQAKQDQIYVEIQVSLAEMKKDIVFIKDKVE